MPSGHDPHRHHSGRAFAAIVASMPLGSVGYEHERNASGDYFICLGRRIADKLFAERRRSEDISDTIVRLATAGGRLAVRS